MCNFVVIIVPADALAPSGARPSAGTDDDQGPVLYTRLACEGFYPSALGAGGVLSSRSGRVGVWTGGRLGGRLPNLRNPYLGNRSTDFLNSKFCGIV